MVVKMYNNEIQSIYDKEAVSYDSKYMDKIHLIEDKIIGMIIRSAIWPTIFNQKILDIGCGTGHVIDLAGLKPRNYHGIDISEKSIEEAQRKFPDHSFQAIDVTESSSRTKSDLALFIYGQVNYIGIKEFIKIIQTSLKINQTKSRFMAVLYCGDGHEDYSYTKGYQTYYKPSEIKKAFNDFSDYEPYINGFSWIDEGDDLQKQLIKTVTTPIEDGDEYKCKYLIVSNLEVLKNANN